MVGRISGMTKVSDCERTLSRQTKDKRKTRHVGEEGRDFSTAGDDETIPEWRTFYFTLYKRLTNNRYAEQGNKNDFVMRLRQIATNRSRHDV